ncbi:IS66-like element accessory protein TnpA [Rhodopila sp.]|uniref:IS66-like element accessory protein TnpA n=1 Tax=Rhodopila sp. TaxID=2480087 RepID=UPI003D0D8485
MITRDEPRRRWSLEQKQAIAAESFQSGVSPTAVARRYSISSGLLYTWRKALLAAQPAAASGSGTQFARVEVARRVKRADPGANVPLLLPGPAVQPAGLIEIVLSDGITVRVDQQIDPRALRRVLSVLAKR